MRTSTRLGAAMLSAGAAAALVAIPPAGASSQRVVPVTHPAGVTVADSYIVTVTGDPRGVAARLHVPPRFVYDRVLHGFAAHLTDRQLAAAQHDPRVVAIEQDAVVHANATPWGLDRINQRHLPLDGNGRTNRTGSSATAYVIDTGIAVSHPDFGGRARVAYDALGGNGIDCNGHGTHVAGIIGGATYGVAKAVQLRAVRVLDCSGSGTNSGVIAGMNWVASNHVARSVANMSLGGGFSSAVNTGATNLANSGVFLSVAAGASNADACNYSPASAAGAYAAAASDINDARASFNNYGSCVDIYAPGVSITSDWLNGGTNTLTGNSMSAAFVTGVAALYKDAFGDAATSTVASWLTTNATTNVITGNPSGTPNRLLYTGGL